MLHIQTYLPSLLSLHYLVGHYSYALMFPHVYYIQYYYQDTCYSYHNTSLPLVQNTAHPTFVLYVY